MFIYYIINYVPLIVEWGRNFMQRLDFEKISKKKNLRIPDVVLNKLEAKIGDSIVFYLNDGKIILKKGEIT